MLRESSLTQNRRYGDIQLGLQKQFTVTAHTQKAISGSKKLGPKERCQKWGRRGLGTNYTVAFCNIPIISNGTISKQHMEVFHFPQSTKNEEISQNCPGDIQFKKKIFERNSPAQAKKMLQSTHRRKNIFGFHQKDAKYFNFQVFNFFGGYPLKKHCSPVRVYPK